MENARAARSGRVVVGEEGPYVPVAMERPHPRTIVEVAQRSTEAHVVERDHVAGLHAWQVRGVQQPNLCGVDRHVVCAREPRVLGPQALRVDAMKRDRHPVPHVEDCGAVDVADHNVVAKDSQRRARLRHVRHALDRVKHVADTRVPKHDAIALLAPPRKKIEPIADACVKPQRRLRLLDRRCAAELAHERLSLRIDERHAAPDRSGKRVRDRHCDVRAAACKRDRANRCGLRHVALTPHRR
eukprot:Amastigsp_a842679_8.p2 type:complete len:242 gc:universal Amastigsp_a842679_8:1571-846(-)